MDSTNAARAHQADDELRTAANPPTEALLGVYQEICKSYHDIDDFRMKLLGLLPLTSLIGIFGLSNESLFAQPKLLSQQLIAFIGIFAAAFTLALFIYEIRGILRCNDLIRRGREVESLLNIHGQFFVCVEEHECKRTGRWIERLTSFFDAKLAACLIYSTVFAAWVFTVLRFGFDGNIRGCAFSALAIGSVIGVATFLMVKRLVAA